MAAPMTETVNDEVVCRRRGAVGHVLLNRPQALNALTLNMVRGIAAGAVKG